MSSRVVVQSKGADKLTRAVIDEMTRQIYAEREEIMQAFIAKNGFDADKCQQINRRDEKGNQCWSVVAWTDEDISKARQSVISHRLGVEFAHLPWWKKLLFRLAGWK